MTKTMRTKIGTQTGKVYMTEGDFVYGKILMRRVLLTTDLSQKLLWKPALTDNKVQSNIEKYYARWGRRTKS